MEFRNLGVDGETKLYSLISVEARDALVELADAAEKYHAQDPVRTAADYAKIKVEILAALERLRR